MRPYSSVMGYLQKGFMIIRAWFKTRPLRSAAFPVFLFTFFAPRPGLEKKKKRNAAHLLTYSARLTLEEKHLIADDFFFPFQLYAELYPSAFKTAKHAVDASLHVHFMNLCGILPKEKKIKHNATMERSNSGYIIKDMHLV